MIEKNVFCVVCFTYTKFKRKVYNGSLGLCNVKGIFRMKNMSLSREILKRQVELVIVGLCSFKNLISF